MSKRLQSRDNNVDKRRHIHALIGNVCRFLWDLSPCASYAANGHLSVSTGYFLKENVCFLCPCNSLFDINNSFSWRRRLGYDNFRLKLI